MVPFFVFLFCLFLTLGIYLLSTRKSDAQRAKLKQRLAETLLFSAGSTDAEVQLAREELLSEIPILNRVLLRLAVASRLRRMIEQADLSITVLRLLMFSAMAGMLAAMAVSMISLSWLLTILAGCAAAALPFVHVWWKRKQRFDKFLEQLPDALELMSRALSAGHAFSESLQMIANEMPDPIAGEFRKTYEEQNLGLSVKLALENLAARIPLLDLR
ncbi:MAG: type II secretion system F family protein, partial [Pyrinomonadaceae bacterium]|nr:type II secretion system F family protein [Pyrinomonadaceae bacterium]